MSGDDNTMLIPPSAAHSGFYASGGGCNDNNNELLGQLHNNSAIWNSSAFATAAMDRFGYAIQHAVESNGRDNIVETTRQGMAGQLATEKVGAANALAAANNTREILLQAENHNAAVLRAIAECCCEVKAGQAATNALILAQESGRVRDELAAARQEILLNKIKNGNGNGNGGTGS